MKRILPLSAKRTLAFALALVLLLSLCPILPLTANAAVYTGGWQYYGSYNWLTDVFFESSNATNVNGIPVFEDDEAYDWKVTVYQARTTVPITTKVTIKDASGAIVGGSTVNGSSKNSVKGETSTMFSASEYPALTTDLFGTFTLTCELYYNNGLCGTLTQTFRRVSSSTVTSSISSRSKPGLVFSVSDPLDLVLDIKKTDGIKESFQAAITVTGSNNNELLAARGVSLPASTHTSLILKDLMDIPAIAATGSYNVNLTLTDSSGDIQHQSSHAFTVVGLVSHISCEITSATNPDLTFLDIQTYDLAVQLEKKDHVAESITAAVTVTNSAGNVVLSQNKVCNIPATGAFTFTPDLSGLTESGDYQMKVVLTDASGTERGSTVTSFSRVNTESLAVTLTNTAENTGRIYVNSNTIKLTVGIKHPNGIGQKLLVRYSISVDGTVMANKETSTNITSTSTKNVVLSLSDPLCYGVNDIKVDICSATGTVLRTVEYSYARVLSTADPGDLPLLNLNVHYTNMGTDPMLQQVNFSSTAGANMWRSSITWDSVEKTKGVYTMPSQLTSVMNQTRNTGMQALVVLAYNNNNTDANGKKFYGEPDPDNTTWVNAYAEYCYQVALYMAKNYPNQVVGFEIWNEWNHATMSKVPDKNDRTGAKYAKVVIAASKRIREVNAAYGTNFKVIGGAAAGDGYNAGTNSYNFITSMLSTSGIMDAIDGYSFHTYPKPEMGTSSGDNPRYFEFVSPEEFDYVNRIQFVRNLLNKYDPSGSKEIWLTETGWSTAPLETETDPEDGTTHITTGATELEAASYMVQLYTWALAEGAVDRIFWYDLMNDQKKIDGVLDWDPDKGECNWGLIHSFGNTDAEGEPLAYSAKPGYAAVCAMSSKLTGAANGKAIDLGSGIYAYQFEKNGNYIMVAWTSGAETTLTATFSGNMVISDMYGNATTYSGTAPLNLSETPIYIQKQMLYKNQFQRI